MWEVVWGRRVMKIASLSAFEFWDGPIPLLVERHDSKTFIECGSGDIVLDYLDGWKTRNPDLSQFLIKRVSIPGEGAFL